MKQTHTPSHPRMIYQTDATRERIIETAQAVFMERGFTDTRMQDIARAVGVSRTSLYRYFRDKLDLALVIVNGILEDISAAEQRAGDAPGALGLQRLERHLRLKWLKPHAHREYLFMAEFDAAYSGGNVTQEFRRKIHAALRIYKDTRLTDIIVGGMRDGSIRPDIDPHLTGVTLINAVRSLQQRLLLRGKALMEVKPQELRRMQDEHLRMLMDGLRPRADGKRRKE